jgi:hypothetical protein
MIRTKSAKGTEVDLFTDAKEKAQEFFDLFSRNRITSHEKSMQVILSAIVKAEELQKVYYSTLKEKRPVKFRKTKFEKIREAMAEYREMRESSNLGRPVLVLRHP